MSVYRKRWKGRDGPILDRFLELRNSRRTNDDAVVFGSQLAVVLQPTIRDLREPQPVLVSDRLQVADSGGGMRVPGLVEPVFGVGLVEVASCLPRCVVVEVLAREEAASVV